MQSILNLSEAEARVGLEACLQALRDQGKAATVAIGDAQGEIIALWRMDGASLPSIVIAQNKAYTAARTRTATGDVGRAAQAEGADVHYHGDARYVGWDGGVPVIVQGRCIGAVAVSGLTGAEDLEFAQVGVRAIVDAMV